MDFDLLLKLRLVVARFGEMDNARWWNTRGLLGRLGALALERGFAKSHSFAQARAVFTVAANRCREVFDPPDAVTLWKLPAEIEDEFDSRWQTWLEAFDSWKSFFAQLEPAPGDDLVGTLTAFGLLSDGDIAEVRKLRRAADNRAVPIPGHWRPANACVMLLAAGFFRGEPAQLAVPYIQLGHE